MPTNTAYGQPLSGDQAFDASQPLADMPRGGVESGFNGVSGGQKPSEPQNPLQGMGPLLENADEDVFKAVHNLVLRQERLARNRLAIDTHWTRVKLGYPFSRLEKVQDQDIWRAVLPPGTATLTPAATPNKAADLCSKIVETLMVDPPQPEPQAENDQEEAERAAEMAEEFLTQDGGEKGTNDPALFWSALDGAMTRSSTFLHCWVDKTGGGYIPLQIKAHPQAQDPQSPLLGPDGSPTTDPILRYVSTDEESGQPTQFVTDPSQAGRQWLPKIRSDYWGREHVRIYPETCDVQSAEMVIGLYYTTIGEGKRRWPDTCGQLSDSDLALLCDWTPPRYLVLLPPALRARWKLATGDAKDPAGSSNDERIFFYYCVYRRPTPQYPRGAMVYVSGAFGGYIIGRDTLSAQLPTPDGTDIRCMDIPVVQIRPWQDADDRDPTGRPIIERFGGASEASATLVTSYLEALDIYLHPAIYTKSTSPVEGWQVEQSRATGDHISILNPGDDFPKYEEPRPLPENFLPVLEWHQEQMNSASGMTKPSMGADNQQEVSGVARQIAVRQAMVALSRMQDALRAAFERYWRIKIQLAMRDFTVPQQIRYVGEDGAYKQEWWTGHDFALVQEIRMQGGTGTMMPPQEKVQYIQMMQQAGYVDQDTAADAARPTFAGTLGIAEDPHQQRIERQISAWLKGPPSPEWVQQYQAFQQQQQKYQQLEQQAQQAAAQHQQATQSAQANAHPSAPPAPPQMPPPPTPPWSPFNPLPCDDEPAVASLRRRRLSKLQTTARFAAQPPEWQQVAIQEYNNMRQVESASQAPQVPRGVTIAMKGDETNVAAEERAAASANQQQQAA